MIDRWYGPAVVLGREQNRQRETNSYWVAHNGHLLLVATEHLRSATREERLAHAVITQIMGDMRGHLQGDRPQLRFQDLRPEAEREANRVEAEPVIEAMQAPVPPPAAPPPAPPPP